MKQKQVKWMKCGAKIASIALILIITTIITVGQSTLIGEMSLTEEEIYRGKETELKVEIESPRDSSLEEAEINLVSEVIGLEEKAVIGTISSGGRWTKDVKINTHKNTSIGTHEIQGQLSWGQGSMKLNPVELTVKEVPIKIETSFEKERAEPEEDNELTIKVSNEGEEELRNVEIKPNFDELAFIHTEKNCSRTYTEMRSGDSSETKCKFYATEDASRETELEIEIKFQDQEDETHKFREYAEIKVDTTIMPGAKTFIAIAIAAIILLMFLKTKI